VDRWKRTGAREALSSRQSASRVLPGWMNCSGTNGVSVCPAGTCSFAMEAYANGSVAVFVSLRRTTLVVGGQSAQCAGTSRRKR